MTTRFGIPTGAWLVGLSAATVLSVVAGIIVGAVHGAWGWMGVPVILLVVLIVEAVAAFRREARDMEFEELAGPLPATDEVDWDLLDQHLRAWSEEN